MARFHFNTTSAIQATIDGVDFASVLGAAAGDTPTVQPVTAGFWNDGGVATFYDGTVNNTVAFTAFDDAIAVLGATTKQTAIEANDARIDIIEGADPVTVFNGLLT